MNWEIDYRETWLHRINPSLKLLVMLAVFIAVLFVHNPNILANLAVALLLLFLAGTGYPLRYLLLFFLPFLLIFVSTASSMMLFGQGTTTWFRWGLVHITEESFLRGMHLGFRALTFALLGLIFSLTTRPVYLFYSLMQQLKLKPKYAYSFLAGIRLIPIMLEEFQTVRNALKVRGAARVGMLEQVKRYAIPLLSQSIRRAQRIAVAMEAKRFSSGESRTFYYDIGFSKYDAIFVLAMIAIMALAYYAGTASPYVPVADVR